MARLTIEEYNYPVWSRGLPGGGFSQFKSIVHAGDPAPDFTLPLLDGGEVTLSSLRGKPVMVEFGSIT